MNNNAMTRYDVVKFKIAQLKILDQKSEGQKPLELSTAMRESPSNTAEEQNCNDDRIVSHPTPELQKVRIRKESMRSWVSKPTPRPVITRPLPVKNNRPCG